MTYDPNMNRAAAAEVALFVSNSTSINSTNPNIAMEETPVGTTSTREMVTGSNLPAAGPWFIESIRNYNTAGVYGTQTAYGRAANDGETYTRSVNNGVWTAWKRTVTSANYEAIVGTGAATTGSFTPAWQGVTVGSYNSQSGYYTKISDIVFFQIAMNWNSLDLADTSIASINLPFPPNPVLPITASINDRNSTGFNNTAISKLYFESENGGLGMTYGNNGVTRLTYDNADGALAASGNIYIFGNYVAI